MAVSPRGEEKTTGPKTEICGRGRVNRIALYNAYH